MEACQADSLASEIAPSYYFPNKSYHTFKWTYLNTEIKVGT